MFSFSILPLNTTSWSYSPTNFTMVILSLFKFAINFFSLIMELRHSKMSDKQSSLCHFIYLQTLILSCSHNTSESVSVNINLVLFLYSNLIPMNQSIQESKAAMTFLYAILAANTFLHTMLSLVNLGNS